MAPVCQLTTETGFEFMLTVLLLFGNHRWNDRMVWPFVGANAIGMVFNQDEVAAAVMEREPTFFRNDVGLVQHWFSQTCAMTSLSDLNLPQIP